MSHIILSLVIFVPWLGALLFAWMPGKETKAWWGVGIAVASIDLLLAIAAWSVYPARAGMALIQRVPWLPGIHASYQVGADGISFPLIVLSAFLVWVTAVVSPYFIEERIKAYVISLLVLAGGMAGVFGALDLFLFFFFFESVLIPMYFIIGIWGGQRRTYASYKFLIYTGVGSAAMLLGFFVLYAVSGSLSIPYLLHHPLPLFWQEVAFWLLLLGFAVKTPLVPLHTWLPDVHVEAPTPGSMLLAGVLLKIGTYGIIRFDVQMLPGALHLFAGVLVVLAVINVLYGATLALAQKDIKRMVAYASVSSMGYVLLGSAAGTSVSLAGATMQMVAHGVVSAFLFLAVGAIYRRAHTRDLDALGGLTAVMPVLGWLTLTGVLAYVGLPGLMLFVSEVSVFLGSYGPYPLATALASFGLLPTAFYLMRFAQRVLFGPLRSPVPEDHLPDVRGAELLGMAVLVASMLVVGFYPESVLRLITPATHHLAHLLALGGNP